ncbi:MAG: GNAT family N-acetyltransferase [Nocardioidaceae bacterium]
MRIRPMTLDDIPAAERLSAVAFHDLDLRTQPPGFPPPELRSPDRAQAWVRRLRHLVEHDAPGCWVAEDDEGRIVGQSIATVREGLWGLSNYGVLPDLQARGIGKQLLEASLAYGDPTGPGIICASPDPRATRRYRLAGFAMHPAMMVHGTVDRQSLPALPDVRAGSAEDVDLLDAIDRKVRGAGHGPDFPVMMEQFGLKVLESGGSRGYAFHLADGSPYLLAATDVEAAQAVLWACLAESSGEEPVEFDNLTAPQQWAVDVGLAAGLAVHARGFVGLRNLEPPTPYIPSGHFL